MYFMLTPKLIKYIHPACVHQSEKNTAISFKTTTNISKNSKLFTTRIATQEMGIEIEWKSHSHRGSMISTAARKKMIFWGFWPQVRKPYRSERITMRGNRIEKVMGDHRGVIGHSHQGTDIAGKKEITSKAKKNSMKNWRRIAGREISARRDKAGAYLKGLIRRRSFRGEKRRNKIYRLLNWSLRETGEKEAKIKNILASKSRDKDRGRKIMIQRNG